MNKLMVSVVGATVILGAASMGAWARGAMIGGMAVGHISPGGVSAGGSFTTMAATGASGGAKTNKAGVVHGYNPTSMTTAMTLPVTGIVFQTTNGMIASGGTPAGTNGSSIASQLQARGVVPGVGNSLGNVSSLRGEAMGGDIRRSPVAIMAKQLTHPTSTTTGGKHPGASGAAPSKTIARHGT